MAKLIIGRHADYTKTKEATGDGPLTEEGKVDARLDAGQLASQLASLGITAIDHAVVSGSIRGSQTFAIYWSVLLEKGIQIWEYQMDKQFFSTKEEDAKWADIAISQREKFLDAKTKNGEVAAVMEFAGEMVEDCAVRTVKALKAAQAGGAEVMMCMTHGPHDILIASYYGHKFEKGIAKGSYRILDIA